MIKNLKKEDVLVVRVMFKRILNFLKITNDDDKRIIEMIQKSPYIEHLRISEKGSLHIDPKIVRETKEFKEALKKAEKIVKLYNK